MVRESCSLLSSFISDRAADRESLAEALSFFIHERAKVKIRLLQNEGMKRQRKIFFLVAWLDAFIGGQQSGESDQIARSYLDTAQIEPDTRLKILSAVDELDRTVRIRNKYLTCAARPPAPTLQLGIGSTQINSARRRAQHCAKEDQKPPECKQ